MHITRLRILEILVTAFFIAFPFGQFLKISLTGQGGIYAIDVIAGLIVLSWFVLYRKEALSYLRVFPFGKTLGAFLLIAILSLVVAAPSFSLRQVVVSSFYLFRLLFYMGLFVVISFMVSRKTSLQRLRFLMLLSGVVLLIFGYAQYLILPDFRAFTIYGWDPHYYRMLSTFLDPNFFGGFMALFMIFLVALHHTASSSSMRWVYRLLLVFSFGAVFYSLSRSTYLAYLVGMGVISLFTSRKVFVIAFLAIIVATMSSERATDRVSGAVKVDETAQARVDSWQNAVLIGNQYPVLGVGFNTYRYVQERMGFFGEGYDGGHAGAGVDSSSLFVFVTMGTVGFTAYLFFVVQMAFSALFKARKHVWAGAFLATLVALFADSQFVNSFFYPWILGWFVVMGGIFVGKVITINSLKD